MIRGYAIQIISLICIILFWLWLLRQLQYKLGLGVFMRCSLYATLSVIIIAGLARLKHNFSILPVFPILSITLLGILLRRGSRLSFLLQSLLVIGVGSLIPSFSPSFTNVRSEESLKQGSLQGGGKKSIFSDNTSLFMLACVSAAVFGSIENILFFIKAFHESNTDILNYIIQRSLIPVAIHITSLFVTLIIASQFYRYYDTINKKRETNTQLFLFTSLSLIIASMGGIVFHLSYNISLDHQIWVLVPLLFFVGIGIISYGLFRSDILYIPSQ